MTDNRTGNEHQSRNRPLIDWNGFMETEKQEIRINTVHHLPDRVVRDVTRIARRHNVERVILFGSRARGTHTERSDIDIAVCGGDYDSFCRDVRETVHSLLLFDVVEYRADMSEALKKEIERDGVVIYEKAG